MNTLRSLHKWGVFFKVLPFTLLFCATKFFFHWRNWEPWQFDAFTASLFGTSTFVIALVLNGTLAEYRSSEEIPNLIVNSLEEIEDCSCLFASINEAYDPTDIKKKLTDITQGILNWLQEEQSIEYVYQSLDNLNLVFSSLAIIGGVAWINRPQQNLANVRLLVARMKANRETDYLGPAYVLLWIFLGGSIVALLLISSNTFSENLTVAAFIFTSFVYLVILIRDLDDPFQYDGSSSVDIDLSVLQFFCSRRI